jgi:hypothetical protein
MKQETIEKLNDLLEILFREESTQTLLIGDVIIQQVFWRPDEDDNVYYDIENIRIDIDFVLKELEEHNDNTNYNWEDEWD